MLNSDEVKLKLSQTPFRDIFTLVSIYNEKKSLAESTSPDNILHKELTEITKAMYKVIENIKNDNPHSVRQGIVLLGCHDSDIVKLLINKLLTEIHSTSLHFGDLYAALNASIPHSSTSSTDDQLQIAQQIAKDLNTIHAPDIQLSCLMVQSLYAALFKMIEKKDIHLYSNHKKSIERSVRNLETRLQAVKKGATLEQKEVINNIKEALAFSKHVIATVGDHRTSRNRMLHGVKLTAMLLLQAAEAAGECYGAVQTCGATSGSALSSVCRLMTNVFKRGQQAFRHFHDKKGYFKALLDGRSTFDNLIDNQAAVSPYIKRMINPAGEQDPKIKNHWYDPHFQLGALQAAYSDFELFAESSGPFIELFLAYYNGIHSPDRDQATYAQVKSYAAFCLLTLNDNGNIPPALGPKVQAEISLMTKADRKLYDSRKKLLPPISEQDLEINNVAEESWKQIFSDDVELYKNIFSFSKLDHTQMHLDYIKSLQARAAGASLSSWGHALLKSIKLPAATEGQTSSTLPKYTLQQNVEFIRGGLTADIAKGLGRDLYDLTIKSAGSMARNYLETGKVSEGIQEYQNNSLIAFTNQMSQLANDTLREVKYIHDVIGLRLFEPTTDAVIDEEHNASTLTLAPNH